MAGENIISAPITVKGSLVMMGTNRIHQLRVVMGNFTLASGATISLANAADTPAPSLTVEGYLSSTRILEGSTVDWGKGMVTLSPQVLLQGSLTAGDLLAGNVTMTAGARLTLPEAGLARITNFFMHPSAEARIGSLSAENVTIVAGAALVASTLLQRLQLLASVAPSDVMPVFVNVTLREASTLTTKELVVGPGVTLPPWRHVKGVVSAGIILGQRSSWSLQKSTWTAGPSLSS